MTSSEHIARAAALLRAGRLVAFPTETVYGLGANALDARAVQRIYEAKGRPSTSPLIVHVDSPEMALRVVSEWPDEAERLALRYWPGPLTLVLPKRPEVPDIVTAGLSTVGVRIPAHPLALELIREAGVPVAAPSANRFMQLSPTTAEHVRASLGDAVDMVLDGGACPVGIESTVLSLAGGHPVLLRPGMVSRAEIEGIIGPVEIAASPESSQAHASPGMHSRHYAPRTPLRLGLPSGGEGEAFLWLTHRPAEPGLASHAVQMPSHPERYAAMLYGLLHSLDQMGLREIVVEPPPEGSEWDGIRDRLTRAATAEPSGSVEETIQGKIQDAG